MGVKNSIVFMGTPAYAAKILSSLIEENFNILAVFTQSDKAVGRKQIISPSAVKLIALEHNLKVFTPSNLKDAEVIDTIKALKPDFIVVAAYGKILPKEILNICPCINLHTSLLPKYRGASPIQSAILNADKISGVCIMLMDEGLDSGGVLESIELEIKDKRADEVFDMFSLKASSLCISTLKNFAKIAPKKQDESKATFCKKISKSDGLINLDEARAVYQKFLAFYPWPGIFLDTGLKFIDISLLDESSVNDKAKILEIRGEDVVLSCKKGTLLIHKLQEPGKKICTAKQYLNGKRLKSGDYLYPKR